MSRPTVRDIAKEAGVSLATVDRVLNARAGVREETIAKVQAAVERLGYVRDTYAANLARQRQYRFVFVLPESQSEFMQTLREALNEAYASQIAERVVLQVATIPAHDPHGIVRCLESLDVEGLDGVAVMAPETPQVRDAVARLKAAGLAVVALASDLPNSKRDYFIGVDNTAAGRTAALLMGRFAQRPGEILVVTNTMRSRDSLDRRLGFDEVVGSEFGHLKVLPSLEFFDDAERMTQIVEQSAQVRKNIVGIYSMGYGNRALITALQECADLRDLVVITHELTPATREALRTGGIDAVIAQNVGHLVRSALRVLRSLCDGVPIYDAQERLRIEIILKENLF